MGDLEEAQLYQRQEINHTIDRLESADPFICVIVICGCSFVVLCQAAVECRGTISKGCSDEYGYSVGVGVVSFLLSFLSIIWSNCGPRSFTQFSPVVAIFFL